MEDPDMLPVVMSVFNAGATASEASKAAALADMRVAAVAFSKNWTYKKVAERTQTGTGPPNWPWSACFTTVTPPIILNL
jgi:hypothetical protein